jgi:hypothetical protein
LIGAGDLALKGDCDVEVAPEALDRIGDELIWQFYALVWVRIVDVHIDNVIGLALI